MEVKLKMFWHFMIRWFNFCWYSCAMNEMYSSQSINVTFSPLFLIFRFLDKWRTILYINIHRLRGNFGVMYRPDRSSRVAPKTRPGSVPVLAHSTIRCHQSFTWSGDELSLSGSPSEFWPRFSPTRCATKIDTDVGSFYSLIPLRVIKETETVISLSIYSMVIVGFI